MTVGCLGEVMLELIPGPSGQAQLGVAGDTYNTAVYLARALGPGQVDYITMLGRDGFSDTIRRAMNRYHLGTGRIDAHPTRVPGLYAIETDAAGERRFTYWRDSSAARCLGQERGFPELLQGLGHLYYSGISLAILSDAARSELFRAIAGFRDAGGVVAFDSNYRPHLWADVDTARRWTERAWAACDVALPSLDDEMALFGDTDAASVLARLTALGVGQGALKQGALGPRGLDGQPLTPAPLAVRAVDTTAAGDSFNAGYLAALVSGEDHASAMRQGHELASRVVAHPGAIIF